MRKVLWRLSIVAVVTLGTSVSEIYAQEENYTITDKFLTRKEKSLKEKLPFAFRNPVSNIYYYDYKLKNKINKLIEEKKTEEVQPLLEEYVSHFGILNFNKDADMLWKLGQLYEATGNIEPAKYLYRLVLKHKEADIEKVWKYYDDISANEKDYYVPIEYYFKLVEYRKHIDTLRPPRKVLVDMGSEINSPFDDYGPALSLNDDMLMFSSKRHILKQHGSSLTNEDLYFTFREGEDAWSEAIPFEGGINSIYNEGSPCLTKDGNTLFFVRCHAPDGLGNCDIYIASKEGENEWGAIQNLGSAVNSEGWDSHPSLSHTGDTLYFVSDREGGFGSTDIYFSRLENGRWTPAQNMGPVINTRETEVSPFMHPRFDVFYFSSNSQILNFGQFDIYKTNRIDGIWQEPKNIGPLVNGFADEFYFTIDAESQNLYYARTEKGNKNEARPDHMDLYSFPLPMEAQPEANTLFGGTLTNEETGDPFQGIVSIIDLDNGIEVAPKYVRPDGTFEFELKDKNKYLLIIQGDDFFRIEKTISLNGDTVLQMKAPSLKFERLQFSSIEFASNSAEILPEMEPDLDKLMNFMLDNPQVTLKISGHTDSKGNPDMNMALSQSRADAIKTYLVDNGNLDEGRIEAIGYGSTLPIIKPEKTEEDRRVNRRVEFELTNDGKPLGEEG